ncbi:hypothetical protein [Methylocystis parvus]|uniref:Sulfur globule protein n=1 Tax=Methylocystis parvus TaxID=134 RepID=A0A6B8M607_9HYPH|nr:hypothetical protein [Methylocystis parvus]QGM98321.1 hypothetical protein F7D14_13100 [Methylocystis parvus]WBK01351.1 hypothetical protein MMG94_06475 [Methylocystis parvus OBBP]
MRKSLKLALAGSLLGAMTATAIPTEVSAGPMGVAPPSTVGLSAPVDKVWYRRWGGGYGYRGYGYRGGYRPYYGGYYRRGNPGAAVAAGVGLGLLGAGLAASSGGYYGGYYPYYNGGYYPSYGYGYGYPSYNYWGW